MSESTPLTDAHLVDIRAALDDPAVAWTESDRVIDALLATVDAERARADQAEAERTALVARLHQWASEWLCHLPTTARMHVAFRRALDASPTEGNPE